MASVLKSFSFFYYMFLYILSIFIIHLHQRAHTLEIVYETKITVIEARIFRFLYRILIYSYINIFFVQIR